MATKSNIYKDPRWLSLVEKYKDNWVLAAKELFDIDLSHQQQQIVEAIQPNNAKSYCHHSVWDRTTASACCY